MLGCNRTAHPHQCQQKPTRHYISPSIGTSKRIPSLRTRGGTANAQHWHEARHCYHQGSTVTVVHQRRRLRGGATRTTTSTGIPTPSHGTLHAHTAAQHINTTSTPSQTPPFARFITTPGEVLQMQMAHQLPRSCCVQVLHKFCSGYKRYILRIPSPPIPSHLVPIPNYNVSWFACVRATHPSPPSTWLASPHVASLVAIERITHTHTHFFRGTCTSLSWVHSIFSLEQLRSSRRAVASTGGIPS